MSYQLETRYDSRKSFYGKAVVAVRDGYTELLSYGTLVARIYDGNLVKLYPAWDASQTTLRHVKEYLRQAGCYVGSKAEMEKAYADSYAAAV